MALDPQHGSQDQGEDDQVDPHFHPWRTLVTHIILASEQASTNLVVLEGQEATLRVEILINACPDYNVDFVINWKD